MARPLRIEFEDAFYHIISRGHRKENIYRTDKDKDVFLKKLKDAVKKYTLKLHAFILMDNHFHLLVQTPFGNLCEAMHYLNSSYTNWFKARYGIVGSVFQGRYKSVLVDKDNYLLTLSAYIHLNPVRAGIVDYPENYKYSSCRGYFSGKFDPELIYSDDILQMLSGSLKKYKNFVYEWMSKAKEIKKDDVYGKNGILGSSEFRENVLEANRELFTGKEERELPELKNLKQEIKEMNAKEIGEIIKRTFKIDKEILFKKKKGNIYRNLYMYGLKKFSQMKLKEIGELFGIDYSTVTMNTNSLISKSKNDSSVRSIMLKFEEKMISKIEN
jgi:REP element-mobilizing transposase RayT